MDFRWDIVIEYLPLFIDGMKLTLLISLLGVIFGSIWGLLIAFGRMIKNGWLRFPFSLYVNFFRCTPMLVQLLLIHFGVMPLIMSTPNAVISAIVTLTLNSGAYMAEIYRAGIQSIDRGQTEAARSLGMNQIQAMRFVVLPQAIKRMIPPLGNEFITLIKDSSLASVIAAHELLYYGRAPMGHYSRPWEGLLSAAFIYFVICMTLTVIVDKVEKRLKIDD